jgi:hypothetical protein
MTEYPISAAPPAGGPARRNAHVEQVLQRAGSCELSLEVLESGSDEIQPLGAKNELGDWH